MPGNFESTTFSTEVIRDAGVWYASTSTLYSLLGTTVEGVTFARNAKVDESEIDGQVNAIEGEYRLLSERPTFSGTLRMFDAATILPFMGGASSNLTLSGASQTGTLTPQIIGDFCPTSSYLTNLMVVRQVADGRYLRWVFPRAIAHMGDVKWPTGGAKGSYEFNATAVVSAASAVTQQGLASASWYMSWATQALPF